MKLYSFFSRREGEEVIMKVRVWALSPGLFLANVRISLCSVATSPDLRQYPMEVDAPGITDEDMKRMRLWADRVDKISD